MQELHTGQCGLCLHYGEHHANAESLVNIRVQHHAPEDYLDECNHPKHEALHLIVTPISGCDGFEPASSS